MKSIDSKVHENDEIVTSLIILIDDTNIGIVKCNSCGHSVLASYTHNSLLPIELPLILS